MTEGGECAHCDARIGSYQTHPAQTTRGGSHYCSPWCASEDNLGVGAMTTMRESGEMATESDIWVVYQQDGPPEVAFGSEEAANQCFDCGELFADRSRCPTCGSIDVGAMPFP